MAVEKKYSFEHILSDCTGNVLMGRGECLYLVIGAKTGSTSIFLYLR